MISDAEIRDGRLYSNELRKLAKAMNQRMVELEKRGYKSPAYKSVQARLETLGVRSRTAEGRRFSESGYFTNKNQMAQVEAALRRFEAQQTSKLRGYKQYRRDVLEGLNERYNFRDYGISDDEMLAFWEAMPDDETDRMYASDEIVTITMEFLRDKREREDILSGTEGMTPRQAAKYLRDAGYKDMKARDIRKMRSLNELSMDQIVDKINSSKSMKQALDKLGIDPTEYFNFKRGIMSGIGGF